MICIRLQSGCYLKTKKRNRMGSSNLDSLIKKYNVPVPRYTSYPTVPCWDVGNFCASKWLTAVAQAFNESNDSKGISLYIHLPYCESLCTYCGCNTRITVNHAVEQPYIQAVLKELRMYLAVIDEDVKINELHLGGGTPTFFSPENLRLLVNGIFSMVQLNENADLSFEGHPNNTSYRHLEELRKLGFNRVS